MTAAALIASHSEDAVLRFQTLWLAVAHKSPVPGSAGGDADPRARSAHGADPAAIC